MKMNKRATLFDNAAEMVQHQDAVTGTNSRRKLFSTNSRIGQKFPVEAESEASLYIPDNVRQELGLRKNTP